MEVVATLASGDNRVLIFTRTKHGAHRLARQLNTAGAPAAELHGDLAQGARSRNLAAFGSGEVRVMVATDVAARGIHVDGIDLVIHADPPAEHKAYVHRSGRTPATAPTAPWSPCTAAQAAEVRVLMRKAGVTPQAAIASPGSAVLRSIAGPAVRRIAPVTKLARIPAADGTHATGRGAAAASGSFRGHAGGDGASEGPRARALAIAKYGQAADR